MRILVVEDNRQVARQIREALQKALYVVDVAHDGKEGWFLGDTEEPGARTDPDQQGYLARKGNRAA